jgi:hypothetical protein
MEPLLNNVPPDENEPLYKDPVHRRVEIMVEREVLSLVYRPAANVIGRCDTCGRDVLLLTAETAAAEHGVSTREIYRWLDEKGLHIQEPQGGPVYICWESLKAAPGKDLL